MANIAANGNVYQQMVVPAPYHYHQTQTNVSISQTSVPEKETKRRRRPAKQIKASNRKKNRMASLINSGHFSVPGIATKMASNTNSKSDCSRCNSRKKCFRHLNNM